MNQHEELQRNRQADQEARVQFAALKRKVERNSAHVYPATFNRDRDTTAGSPLQSSRAVSLLSPTRSPLKGSLLFDAGSSLCRPSFKRNDSTDRRAEDEDVSAGTQYALTTIQLTSPLPTNAGHVLHGRTGSPDIDDALERYGEVKSPPPRPRTTPLTPPPFLQQHLRSSRTPAPSSNATVTRHVASSTITDEQLRANIAMVEQLKREEAERKARQKEDAWRAAEIEKQTYRWQTQLKHAKDDDGGVQDG